MADDLFDVDVLIIGGGPAGISAGLWCSDLGLRSAIFDKGPTPGGQLLHTFNPITNYLGIATANGAEMAAHFRESLASARVTLFSNCDVRSADLHTKTISLSSGETITGRAIVIATGVRRRKLSIPGEQEFAQRGILASGAKERGAVAGKTVVIVGGGDAAFENALILSETANKVVLVHRSSTFSARKEFVDRVLADPRIEIITDTVVTAIMGGNTVRAVEIEHVRTRIRTVHAVDAVLIRIGVEPNTELFAGQIETDPSGYLLANCDCSTSIKGVFAVGDAVNPKSPTISAAVGDGAKAASAIYSLLNAEL